EGRGARPPARKRGPAHLLATVARDRLLHPHEPDVLPRQLPDMVVEDAMDRPAPPAQHEPDRGSPRVLSQVSHQELQALEAMPVERVHDVLLAKAQPLGRRSGLDGLDHELGGLSQGRRVLEGGGSDQRAVDDGGPPLEDGRPALRRDLDLDPLALALDQQRHGPGTPAQGGHQIAQGLEAAFMAGEGHDPAAGPPELPWSTVASIWSRSGPIWSVLPETMPRLPVKRSPSGWPKAPTLSPTFGVSEQSSGAARSALPLTSIATTATSVNEST